MKKIGLLAGVGNLPVEYARKMKDSGSSVITIALVPKVSEELPSISESYVEIPVGKVGKILDHLKKSGVEDIVMLGKINKDLIMAGNFVPDFKGIALLAKVKDYKDDTLLQACVDELAKEGFHTLSQMEALKQLLAEPGQYSKRAPSERELQDMDFGLEMAMAIGGLDIGQTVVVKDRAVMAVEAIEGTDVCIMRGGNLAHSLGEGGAVVAKAAKPQQDHRYDVPTVGPDTILMMAQAGATALVMEAGKTFLFDEKRTVALADEKGIAIVAKNLVK
jgi:Uncharacterized protein conserved in bacteria